MDPFAIIRASLSLFQSGRFNQELQPNDADSKIDVSDLRQRTINNKLKQMLYAIRLDAHWSKTKILEAYFTLAPYGGNIEGVRPPLRLGFRRHHKI